MEAGLSMAESDILYKETQIQKYVQDCRSSRHKRPVDSLEEVYHMVEMYKGDENLLRSALCKDIRHRKFLPTVTKSTIHYSPNRR